MINRALVGAVIILAALVILLAAALVKAIADKRIWKETAADCDRETKEAIVWRNEFEKNMDKALRERDNAIAALSKAYSENERNGAVIENERRRITELEKRRWITSLAVGSL